MTGNAQQIIPVWRALLGCAVWLILAAPASGAEFQFSPTQGVWDVTGNYSNQDITSTDTFLLTQDDKGKITGFGSGFGSDSGIDVSLGYDFRGSIKTANNLTRVLLTMKISGSATDGIVTLPVKGSVKFVVDVDRSNNLLIGSGNGSLCVKGRCERANGLVQFDIPQPMDGSWMLNLDNLQSVNQSVTGTATATLSNGRTVLFTGSGHFTSFRRPAQINLKSPAGTITLKGNTIDLGVRLAKAKLLGQAVPTSP
jgi:hypothetical protein